MYVNLIKTNSKSKQNDDTLPKKQKSSAEPTPLLDSAAARLVKTPRIEVTRTKTAKVTYYYFFDLQFCMTMPLRGW